MAAASSRAVSYAGMATAMASERVRRAMEPKTLLQEIQGGLRFDQLRYKSETIESIITGRVERTTDEYNQALKVRSASIAALRATYEMLARYNNIQAVYKLGDRERLNVMAHGSRLLPTIKCGFLEAYFVFAYLLTLKFNEDARMDRLLTLRETGRTLVRAASQVEKIAIGFFSAEVLRIAPRELVGINAMVREFLEDDDIEAACRGPITEILEIPEGGFPRIRGGRTDDAARLYAAIQTKLQGAAANIMPAGRPIAVAALFDRRPAPMPTVEPSAIGVGIKRRPEGERSGVAPAVKERRKNESSNSNSSGAFESDSRRRGRRTARRHRR
ncbi:MAG: hypothetical protein EBZ48_16895 [Proteobacteria bacterium]|nr:hypothetical protein [Pseudomonadota bacterium]